MKGLGTVFLVFLPSAVLTASGSRGLTTLVTLSPDAPSGLPRKLFFGVRVYYNLAAERSSAEEVG